MWLDLLVAGPAGGRSPLNQKFPARAPGRVLLSLPSPLLCTLCPRSQPCRLQLPPLRLPEPPPLPSKPTHSGASCCISASATPESRSVRLGLPGVPRAARAPKDTAPTWDQVTWHSVTCGTPADTLALQQQAVTQQKSGKRGRRLGGGHGSTCLVVRERQRSCAGYTVQCSQGAHWERRIHSSAAQQPPSFATKPGG